MLNISVSLNQTVTHKHCAPPSGCGYYAHNKNYTTSFCKVCEGSLCNAAYAMDLSYVFLAHIVASAMLVIYFWQ